MKLCSLLAIQLGGTLSFLGNTIRETLTETLANDEPEEEAKEPVPQEAAAIDREPSHQQDNLSNTVAEPPAGEEKAEH